MKFVIFFIFSVSLIAQDSSKVKLLSELSINNRKELITSFNMIKKTTLKPNFTYLNSVRSWNKISNINFNSNIAIVNQKKKKSSFIDSDLFLIVAGSAIVLGASAAYFKLESDSFYDKYNTTKNKKYLDKTNRYDIYSGIAFGTLQINFGFLIYKFLTD